MRELTTSQLNQVTVSELVTTASQAPLLNPATEAELAGLVRSGDLQALEQLILSNVRVVIDEAIRNRGLGDAQSELVRRGVEVLLDAGRSYDPDEHGVFSAYAARRVRAALSERVRLS